MAQSSPGNPSDALAAIADAAVTQAKLAEAGRADPLVSVAFALGWQMAEIYNPDRPADDSDPDESDTDAAGDGYGQPREHDLPGLSRLRRDEWEEIGLYQVQAGITKLYEAISGAGLMVPDAQLFADRIRLLAEDERRDAIHEFHVRLLSTFTAADHRLGKAYGLGRALADTTREPERWHDQLREGRVDTLAACTRDLATAFPPHAGHAVARSLQAWGAWAEHTHELDAPTGRQLSAQGRLWRSLLSREKRATDMLNTASYLSAAEYMLQASRELAAKFARKYTLVLVALVLVLMAAVAVMFIFGGAPAIVTGASAILGTVGLTWKGAGTSLGKAAAGVETPLWGAAIDKVVTARITPQHVLLAFTPAPEEQVDEPSLVAAKKGLST
jgi:hypothetical protein